MDFANGMGASDSAVRQREVQPEMHALIGTFFRLIQQENAAVGLAALYAYESRVPAIAKQKAAGLCAYYKADAKTCRYFTVHETADVHHAEVWKHAITKELERDPASADRALDAAETAAKALWDALDGVERLRMQRMAN
jgi:pyrroloquinoline-quinone synthase